MKTLFSQDKTLGWKAFRQALLGVAWTGLAALFLGVVPASAQGDPPGRVGRLNYVQGQVSFSPAGSDEWVEARTTRPITSGDRIWMGRGARSELSIGAAVLRADEESSLKVLQLDDDQAQFELSQGTLALQVRNMDPDDRLEISTPNLAFVIDRPGDYRIQVDPERNTTEIALRRGEGTAYADDGRHRLSSPAYARFDGNGLDRESSNLPRADDFDNWVDARIDRAASRESARYLSRDMVGYEDLDDHGSWQTEPEYGRIWVPRITISGWAPYRYGHWAWIAPWGWTWVDDAPWGFAPFHYGRWAYLRGHWCWVPGPVVRRPYYAPALVAFVGSPGGWSLNISSGAPAVAWFPLGPRESYRPVYRSSPTYITQINRTVVIVRDGDRPHRPDHYENRFIPGAATALPARSFVEGRSAQRDMIRVSERDLAQAPIAGTMPTLAPVRQSLVGQNDRRLAPPPRAEQTRPVISTRPLPLPAVERDELAQRFAREGRQVQEAGPPLASEPRRSEQRETHAPPRVIGESRQERDRHPPRGTEPQERNMEAPRESPRPPQQERPFREDRPSRDRDNEGPRPTEARRVDRQRPPESIRPPDEPRVAPPVQRERDAEPREFAPVRPRAPEPEAPGRYQRPERMESPRRQEAPPEIQRPQPQSAPQMERPEENRRPQGERMEFRGQDRTSPPPQPMVAPVRENRREDARNNRRENRDFPDQSPRSSGFPGER